jgi:hypothetical protein
MNSDGSQLLYVGIPFSRRNVWKLVHVYIICGAFPHIVRVGCQTRAKLIPELVTSANMEISVAICQSAFINEVIWRFIRLTVHPKIR